MRISFEDGTVHESAGVALVGIDDHILCIARGLASSVPLDARGKTTTASSSEPGFFDLLHDLLGRHLEKSLGERRIAAKCQIVVDALRIDLDVVADDVPLLMFVERNVGLTSSLFVRGRVGIEQAIDDLLLLYGFGDDFGNVLRGHLQVAGLLRIDDDDGSTLTESWAAGPLDAHIALKPLFFDFGVKGVDDFTCARGETTGTSAY